jgi:hypothetical protein
MPSVGGLPSKQLKKKREKLKIKTILTKSVGKSKQIQENIFLFCNEDTHFGQKDRRLPRHKTGWREIFLKVQGSHRFRCSERYYGTLLSSQFLYVVVERDLISNQII